ncbi:hypothetical protein ABZ815_01155 [Nonomuraea sp. NPDC047529]
MIQYSLTGTFSDLDELTKGLIHQADLFAAMIDLISGETAAHLG